ncbi:FKBP-type peptidyl-prolyl cis-trans isomerase [Desulfotalea psychrophila]|uniref:Peptidyl-prolyl cis-trans isomerase n=1 Tax=Desulfotalea psychrophila (strain LSv54 / DSM 12343) TaxID=177439 RepID=Q6AP28_DESPS|nr:FKBP-type peptidyl-prolyl cis-trans isomerase [Desulfotalea psychrophila]CAG35896.1 probable outer membrane protein MIP (macrophage infectivity potentiator) [Desulfotalea psychrophila LSv54]
MKKKIVAATLGVCLVMPLWAQSAESNNTKLKTFEDKLSYSIGTDIGKSLGELKEQIRFDSLILGLTDTYEGKKGLLSAEEMKQVQQQFVAKMQADQAKKMVEMQKKNKAAGDAFLAANAKKKGVVTTKSGLQYNFVKKGKGVKPALTDIVSVNYTGTLINGTEFDSSIKRGKPVTFPVAQVISGWSEALQLMPVGSSVHLVIPAALAYGDNGAPPVIEPGSVLVFDVDLISIGEEKKATPATAKK